MSEISPKKKRGKKKGSTEAGVKIRRDALLNQMLEGKTKTALRQWYTENYPNLTLKSLNNDMVQCYEKLREYTSNDTNEIITDHVHRYDILIDMAIDAGFVGEAVKAMQAKEKLLRLHNPDVAIQNNTLNVDLSNYSIEQLKEMLNQ